MRAQSSFEFLLTYGLGFLAVALFIGALVYFMPSDDIKLVKNQCISSSEFPCVDYYAFSTNNQTNGGLQVTLVNGNPQAIRLESMTRENNFALRKGSCVSPPSSYNASIFAFATIKKLDNITYPVFRLTEPNGSYTDIIEYGFPLNAQYPTIPAGAYFLVTILCHDGTPATGEEQTFDLTLRYTVQGSETVKERLITVPAGKPTMELPARTYTQGVYPWINMSIDDATYIDLVANMT